VIVQNIRFSTDNVEYQLNVFSVCEKKTYEAELPVDIVGIWNRTKAFIVIFTSAAGY